ncbi:MAG: hypothetical protein ACSHWU_13265 [Marinicella sp.]
MHTLTAHSNWQNHRQAQHWIKHSIVPVAVICLVLMLPKPWTMPLFQASQEIELELLDPILPTPEPLVKPIIEQPKIEPITKTIEKLPVPTEQIIKPVEQTVEQPTPTVPQEASPPQPNTKPITQPQLSAGDVLQMIENRTSIDITPEFQARTGPAKDFYIPEQEIHDWLADIPFLDESVDKPKLQMKFYAEGFTGSIEKFFDKITIKKTFTTKYGTKIHCAVIGVIAACGWK